MSIITNPPTEDLLFKMPAGEWHIRAVGSHEKPLAFVQGASADDLMALCIWADACHRRRQKPRAFIPYLPGARQDRAHDGEALSSKVYAGIINSCHLECVAFLDPHSDVMPALIEQGIAYPSDLLTLAALPHAESAEYRPITAILAPDAGARRRAEAVGKLLRAPVHQCLKTRDPFTGRLSGFQVPTLDPSGNYLLVDDICDGGGTFKAIAQASGVPRDNLSLWVTHGVFSGLAHELPQYFRSIYTTNSHPGAEAFKGAILANPGSSEYRCDITIIDAARFFGWPHP